MTAAQYAWRVTMFDTTTNTASIDQFPTEAEAKNYAAAVRRRHPDWEVDVVRWWLSHDRTAGAAARPAPTRSGSYGAR